MPSFTPAELPLFLTALVAAMVNGALGYGFSSITVPVALGFVATRVLHPALVLLEKVGVPFGLGLGVLYSTTTLSGPPLALLLNNQGLAQDEFRAAIALIRVAESSFTLVTYLFLGFHGAPSLGLFFGSAWQRFLQLRKSQVASP
jgi:hypothetical protein